MVKIWIDRNIGKIKVLTDSESIISLFKITLEEKSYSPWMKKWIMSKVTYKIYDNTRAKIGKSGTVELVFGLGWAAYLVNSLRPYVTESEINDILSGAVFSENPRLVPFKELRDYQNEDVLHVLKFKVGLFSCYTSYGKLYASNFLKPEI